jgi:4-amino-4-deoxy-L-arabinose transferase-like glycosyltransferase
MRFSAARRDVVTVASLATLVLALPMTFGVPVSVGIPGALRILDGEVPYRDFWTMYAPGHFYLQALLFALFGKRLILAGVAAVVVSAGSVAVFFLIGRRLGMTRAVAGMIAALFAFLHWTRAPALTTYQPALFLMLLGWLAWLGRERRTDWRTFVAAGACLGAAAWFKHDIAAYATIAMAGTELALGPKEGGSWRDRLRGPLVIGLTAFGVVLPVGLWLWIVAGRDAWQNVIYFPATDFAASRPEGYPGIVPRFAQMTDARGTIESLGRWLQFNVPLLLWLGGIVALLNRHVRLTPEARDGAALVVASYPFFWLAAHVQINTHIATMSAMALLLGGLAWTTLPPGRRNRARRAAALVTIPYVASLFLNPAMAAARIARDWPESRRTSIPSLWGLTVPARELAYYEPLAAVVDRVVPENECIYVGLRRHDAIIASNMMIYPIVDRTGCSRYDELHPAIADRAPAQREIIQAIDERRARLIILWHFGVSNRALDEIKAERALTLPGTGAGLLDEYLRREFRSVARHGEYEVLQRALSD